MKAEAIIFAFLAISVASILATCPTSTTILTPTVAGWACNRTEYHHCTARTIYFDVKNCDSSSITFDSSQQSSCIYYTGAQTQGSISVLNGGVFAPGNNLNALSWYIQTQANGGCMNVETTAGVGSICWYQQVSGAFNVTTGPAKHCHSK